MQWIPLVILAGAAVYDFFRHEVPHLVWIVLLGWGLGGMFLWEPAVDWQSGLLGVTAGLAIGALLFYLGGMGGGDAKVLAALGAVYGWEGLLVVSLYTALFGGILSIVAAIRGQKEIAYVPAMALGVLVYIVAEGRLPHEILQGL